MRATDRGQSRIVRALVATALLGGTACGEGVTDPAGEDRNGSAVQGEFDLTGVWQFEASRFDGEYLGGGEGITITSVLDLSQEGSAISGTHRDGAVRRRSCDWTGSSTSCGGSDTDVADGSIQGSIQGTTVVLEFDADGSGDVDRYEGTLSGDTIDGSGWSAVRDASGRDSQEEEAAPAPRAPTDLEALVIQTATGPEVSLSWRDNSIDEDGFVVGESCDGSEYAGVDQTDPDATETRIGGPFPGKECSYVVVAFRLDPGEPVFSDVSNVASVTIPAAFTVTGIAPSAGTVGAEVTIRGHGLAPSADPPVVLVNGRSASEFIRSIADDAITLLMPNAGWAGSHEVIVSVGSQWSDPVLWTQEGDGDPSDPHNDHPATAPLLSFPFDQAGSLGDGDEYDLFAFGLAAQATLELVLDWNEQKDLDVYVTNPEVDTAHCDMQGRTFSKPEVITCALPAGDYRLLIEDYDAIDIGDASLVSYRVTALVR